MNAKYFCIIFAYHYLTKVDFFTVTREQLTFAITLLAAVLSADFPGKIQYAFTKVSVYLKVSLLVVQMMNPHIARILIHLWWHALLETVIVKDIEWLHVVATSNQVVVLLASLHQQIRRVNVHIRAFWDVVVRSSIDMAFLRIIVCSQTNPCHHVFKIVVEATRMACNFCLVMIHKMWCGLFLIVL